MSRDHRSVADRITTPFDDRPRRSDSVLALIREKFGTADDPVYTEEEAAAYLRISRRSLQRIRAGRAVRKITYLNRIFYRKSYLDEYILSAEKSAAHVRRRKKRSARTASDTAKP